MRLRPSLTVRALLLVCFLSLTGQAVTLEQLENTPGLTPDKFASFFKSFEFQFHDRVQSPEIFLASRSGDCDDFATLAARILSVHGYTPHLIAVRMPKVVHVVCYIEETGSYLDYNYRGENGLVSSSPDLTAIARTVAKSYGANWSSASEFTFERGAKRLVKTVLEKDKQIASIFR